MLCQLSCCPTPHIHPCIPRSLRCARSRPLTLREGGVRLPRPSGFPPPVISVIPANAGIQRGLGNEGGTLSPCHSERSEESHHVT